MWKPLLKYGAVFILGFISALLIIRWGIYKIFTSREGFQVSTNTQGLVESPATCAMMKLILERAQTNLKNAQNVNDTASINRLQISLQSIQDEMSTINCPH